jgi:putative oxidoreductase
MNAFLSSHAPKVLSILRIITGFLVLWHGSQKFFGFPPSGQPAGGPLPTLMVIGGILELGGGILILFGLFTRPVAFLLSGMMAVAYFGWHAPGGFLPLANHGELAVLYCFVFFYLFFAGGGPWSLDALLNRAPVIES